MRRITDADEFRCGRVALRLVRPDDCNERYLQWLKDGAVNRYLETRWTEQSLESIVHFVAAARAAQDSYLFAIIQRPPGRHIGNIRLGPINAHHGYGDISYFIGERDLWGQGYATEAIRCATDVGFRVLGLHRLQAGVYAENVASARALERVGYVLEGRFRRQLRSGEGWEDHLWYGLLGDEFKA